MRELGIIEDGAVLIADGKIVAVGTTDEVAKHELAHESRGEIDCSGKVVLPGFVDSHTHPVFTAPRLIDFEKRIAGATYEEIAEAGGGIRASLRGVRDASTETLADARPAELSTRWRHTAPRRSRPSPAMASASPPR